MAAVPDPSEAYDRRWNLWLADVRRVRSAARLHSGREFAPSRQGRQRFGQRALGAHRATQRGDAPDVRRDAAGQRLAVQSFVAGQPEFAQRLGEGGRNRRKLGIDHPQAASRLTSTNLT